MWGERPPRSAERPVPLNMIPVSDELDCGALEMMLKNMRPKMVIKQMR